MGIPRRPDSEDLTAIGADIDVLVTDLGTLVDHTPDPVNTGNAPASPGQYLAVTSAQAGTSRQVTVADLVPGVRYRMRLTPDVITNTVRGIWKCAAAAAPITGASDGTPILQFEEVTICLPTGSTKVRVFFWLAADTAFDCHVWLSRLDA